MNESDVVAELLSAEQAIPERCNADIFANGEAIVLVVGPRSWMIERWVQCVAREADAAMDWNFAAGRAVVRALIDSDKKRARVRQTVERMIPALSTAATTAEARKDPGAYGLQWMWL